MPTCRQVCQCGGITGGPDLAETCGTTGEGEDRGTKDIIPDEPDNGDNGGGTKDIPDNETDGGNATSMEPMPTPNADGGDDRTFNSSNYPTQSMPPVPAPAPGNPPVPRTPERCRVFCGGGKGGTPSNRNRNGANNRNEQVGPDIESGEDESFDLSYLYDLIRKYVGYDVLMDSGSANEGSSLAVASDTNYDVEADEAVKN